MATKPERKKEQEDDALRIARRLAGLKPDELSERQWTEKAGVSPSFFSNLRGRPNTGPSNPSIYQLREVLRVVGVTLSEFFADEAVGKISALPTKPALERVIAAALPGRPRQEGRLPEYLAETVLELLQLPPDRLRKIVEAEERSHDEASLPRASTN